MAESFPTTNGGDGAFSYAKNSQLQKESIDLVKAMIEEAIMEKLDADISNSNRVAIVDLGCSVGPNTFLAVQNMIEAVERKTSSSSGLELELEVFFNDHTANDFNKLFASLPQRRPYYVAAVPGSFHGRLFPRACITLAHSSFTLHYLSKLPEETKSPAWNQGRIHYTSDDAPQRVVKGYLDQFRRDMGVFLSARAEEIVKGGLMFLIIPGLADALSHSHTSYAIIFRLIESSVLDLANEGVIGEADVDGFNLPFYFPRAGEVAEAVQENGCFSIETAELTNSRSNNISARAIISHIRAGMEGIFTQHFGKSVMDKVFAKALAKADEASDMVEVSLRDLAQLFYVLKRK